MGGLWFLQSSGTIYLFVEASTTNHVGGTRASQNVALSRIADLSRYRLIAFAMQRQRPPRGPDAACKIEPLLCLT